MSNITVLNEWYKKPIGAALLQSELAGLSEVLPKIFGYYIMQMGSQTNNSEVLAASHIHNRIIVNPDTTLPLIDDSLTIQCQPDELPFLPESIDAVIMFHALEFTQKPKLILKEIYTALMFNGYAIIFGFNPYSLWGISSLWQKKSKEMPWLGNWISPGYMRRYLAKVGFSVGDYKTFYFRPPSNNPEQLLFLERVGQFFWPCCGASYMIIAQKTVTPLTPIRPLFSLAKHLKTAKALPKPTARISQCNK
jgi:SAM-dependent methyltransferase